MISLETIGGRLILIDNIRKLIWKADLPIVDNWPFKFTLRRDTFLVYLFGAFTWQRSPKLNIDSMSLRGRLLAGNKLAQSSESI